jgi:hypothetical protein
MTPATTGTDLTPHTTWKERLAWYSGSMLLSAILVTCGMQLWDRDLRAPFYYDLDALLYLPLTRSVVEQGFWNCWHIDRLGWPGRQELFDFPIIDFLHFAGLWLIGRFVSDTLLVYNLYSLLCYPLTVLTAMWVFRWLKLSLPAAAVGGILYAFLPFHQERYHYHYFLAAYWWVPVSLIPAIAICKGDFPFFRRGPDGLYPPVTIHWRTVWASAKAAIRGSGAAWKAILGWSGRATGLALRRLFTLRSLGWIAMGVVTASAGAYYAFFACASYAFAGLYGWAVNRTWRAAVSAALVIAPVFVMGLAYHIPSIVYQKKFGKNPITQRYPEEADSYGLKVAHLLLPTKDHNLGFLANIRAQFTGAANRPSEGEPAASFGTIGGAGLIALIALVFLPARRKWPEGAIAALALFIVLLGTIGAFGSLFNLLVTPQIRAYNRICVFLGFLSLFIVMWWLDRFLLSRTGRIARQARYPVLAAVLLFGYLDQTPWGWNPLNPHAMDKVDLMAERFRADKRFFKRIEEAMPPGSKIFCLPHARFPESPPMNRMGVYEPNRGYVMTDTLFWSAGAIKYREADAWQQDVAFEKNGADKLKRIVARGFDGLLIDGRGFAIIRGVNQATELIKIINEAYSGLVHPGMRLPEIIHEDGRQFFLDLRPFRDAWQRQKPDDYAQQVIREVEWVAPIFLGGWLLAEPEGGERTAWGPPNAQLVLINPTERTRKFDLSFSIGADTVGPFDVTLSGAVNDSFQLEKPPDGIDPQDQRRFGLQKKYELELPPGRTMIRIRCWPPDYYRPFDSRDLCFYIRDFKLKERP